MNSIFTTLNVKFYLSNNNMEKYYKSLKFLSSYRCYYDGISTVISSTSRHSTHSNAITEMELIINAFEGIELNFTITEKFTLKNPK